MLSPATATMVVCNISAIPTAAKQPAGPGFTLLPRRPRPCWRRQNFSRPLAPQLPQPSRSRGSLVARAVDPDLLTDPDVPLSRLQQLLDEAIDQEDYAAAAQLRDTLQKRRFDARFAVEEANERFYKAFQSGSLKDMAAVWGKGEHVQCIHPLAGCIAGREAVMESWKVILGTGRMKIKIEDVRTYATESTAYVTCLELMDAADSRGRILATNIFEKQEGKWKLVHHHGSPLRSSF